jgi:pimeloyl-ACP methyl ester carboxylesterase
MPYAGQIHYRGSISNSSGRVPLILIHGAGGSYLHWPPEIRHHAGGDILAIDLPGHGASSGEGMQSIAAYARVVHQFALDMGLEQVVLAGHSMGSAVALQVSLDHPDRVSGVILVGSGAKLRVHPQLLEYCASAETYPQVVSQVLDWSFSPEVDQKLVNLAGQRMAEVPPGVMLSDFTACNAFDIREQVGEINPPTLIICGEDDRMTPVWFSQYLAGEIEGSRLEVIPGAGHMVMLEKAEIVAGLVFDFLDQITPLEEE